MYWIYSIQINFKGEPVMDKNKLDETKKLNEDSRKNKGMGGTSGMQSNIESNAGVDEAKKLNQQSRNKKGTGGTSGMS
jgi:hypothetical protein